MNSKHFCSSKCTLVVPVRPLILPKDALEFTKVHLSAVVEIHRLDKCGTCESESATP